MKELSGAVAVKLLALSRNWALGTVNSRILQPSTEPCVCVQQSRNLLFIFGLHQFNVVILIACQDAEQKRLDEEMQKRRERYHCYFKQNTFHLFKSVSSCDVVSQLYPCQASKHRFESLLNQTTCFFCSHLFLFTLSLFIPTVGPFP